MPANSTNGSSFIWCLFMPTSHVFSLISNLICIIIFCSKSFIRKPIAIYFIGLLVSDSITLLIGYSEMVERESQLSKNPTNLCYLNEKIIYRLMDSIYTFMEGFCCEWLLYKVIWTRASTILLAILSIQRSRTFYSLSYRETRFCAVCACFFSIFISVLLTCFEWISVQPKSSDNDPFYFQIFQSVQNQTSAKNFYSSILSDENRMISDDFLCLKQNLAVNFNQVRKNSEKVSRSDREVA